MSDANTKRMTDFSFVTLPAEFTTPIEVLQKCDPIALIESAFPSSGKSRYSIIILEEAFSLAKKKRNYFRIKKGKKEDMTGYSDFLELLNHYRKTAPETILNERYPIPTGGLGYLGYEYFEEIEEITFNKPYEDHDYDGYFVFGRSFLIFDHYTDEMILCSVSYKDETVDTAACLKKTRQQLEANLLKEESESPVFPPEIVNDDDGKQFMENVKIIKDEIVEGNLIQCVISRTKHIRTMTDPKIFYRELRRTNPSPYMFFLKLEKLTLFGTSPEIMVTVNGKKALLRPIAGTRKRGETIEEDIALENELLGDEKERAEHLMLVDLARNDLGKISQPGSVKINDYMTVERYSSVMHIVSSVESQLTEDQTAYSAIKATFTAGTVTGAPKIQAVKTIERLERSRRGPYAGLVGYFRANGDFDSCIVIRSAICSEGLIRLQAGAGIVYDSDPEKEFEETEKKLEALVNIFKNRTGSIPEKC